MTKVDELKRDFYLIKQACENYKTAVNELSQEDQRELLIQYALIAGFCSPKDEEKSVCSIYCVGPHSVTTKLASDLLTSMTTLIEDKEIHDQHPLSD